MHACMHACMPAYMYSKTQLINLQRIKNRKIRFAAKNNDHYDNKTMEELHQELQLEAINVRLYDRMVKLWNKV